MRYLLIFLLLCLPAWAATYHAAAADIGDGTGSSQANAMDFATAVLDANLAAGDTLLLYDDAGDIPAFTYTAAACREGTAIARLTIQAATGESPKFAGRVLFNNYAVDQYMDFTGIEFNAGTSTDGCQVYGGGNVTFTNCKFYGPLNTWTTAAFGPCYSYRASSGYGLYIGPSATDPMNDVTLTGCTFQGYRGFVADHYPRNLTITNCTFQYGTSDLAVITGFDGVTVTGCTFGDINARRYVQWNDGGTVTGTFIVGEVVTQAVSGATGRVDSVAAGVVRFNQSTATDFVANQTITGAGGATVTGTFVVDAAGHGDALQLNPTLQTAITVIEEDKAANGDALNGSTRFTTGTDHKMFTGEEVFITGLTGADAAEINALEWTITRSDATHFAVTYDMTGKTITVPAGTALAVPVYKNLTISRNSFDQGAVVSCYSAIDLVLKKFANCSCDGITVESNVVRGLYTVGAWFSGINTRAHANFVVNNNTFMNTNSTAGIRMGYGNMTTYGGVTVDEMYNNLSVGILFTTNDGSGSCVITAHDNNTMGTADNATQDPSNVWTPGASDIHSATFTSTYFTDYAAGTFTLISGSPAIDTGSALGATNDRNNVAFGLSPERGCYTYVLPSNLRFVLIRK